MLNSLQVRLFLSHLAVVGLTLGVIVGALAVLLLTTPLSTAQTYRHIADIARASFAYLASGGAEGLDNRLLEVARDNETRTLRLDLNGEVLLDSAGKLQPGETLTIRPNREGAAAGALLERGSFTDSQGQEWLTVSVTREGAGTIVFAAPRPRNRIAAALGENLTAPLTQAGLIGAALSIVFASLISAWISRPLSQIARAARALGQGDAHALAPEEGPTEARDLARQFNQMARQTRQARQTQRDFLANVTHELKTPLTSIQGFSQAILDGAATRPAEAAQVIYDEAGRMLRLVEDLLDLAKIESGQIRLARETIDLSALLEHVIGRFSRQASEQNIQLVHERAALPPVVGDPDWLAQVFANLIDNALKHTPPGGKIVIEARQLQNVVEVATQDTGKGIPPEDLERVFERFYQADKSRARSGIKGAGLGLTISKEVMQALGGDLRAERVEGPGARFVATLPLPRPFDQTAQSRRG